MENEETVANLNMFRNSGILTLSAQCWGTGLAVRFVVGVFGRRRGTQFKRGRKIKRLPLFRVM